MNKLKYFRQGQEISIEDLNKLVDNVNDFILLYNQLINFKSEVESAQISHNELINNFISSYYSIIEETPNILEILNAYTQIQPTQVNVVYPAVTIVDNKWYISGVDTGVFATGPAGVQGAEGPQGQQGDRGYTVVPTLTNGVLSWVVYDADGLTVTNHGLSLPSPTNLKGAQGDPGNDGLTTTVKWYFAPSDDPVPSEIQQFSEGLIVPSNYNYFKIETTLEGQSPVSTGWIRYRQPIFVPNVNSQGLLTWTLSGNTDLTEVTINPVNLRGADGTSVSILGKIENHFALPESGSSLGDGYLVGTLGYLFVYTAATDTGGTPEDEGFSFRGFTNVGQIKGDKGDTGDYIEFRVTESHLQTKLSQEEVWVDFLPLEDITGPQGIQGFPIALRFGAGQGGATYLQYTVDDGDTSDNTWTDLILRDNLKADRVELRQNPDNAYIIEQRYVTNPENTNWTELIDVYATLQELFAFAGTNGIDVIEDLDSEGNFTGTYFLGLEENYGDNYNPYASKTASFVLTTPTDETGPIDGKPLFRLLVPQDIPALSADKITSGTFASARLPLNTEAQNGAVLSGSGQDSKVWKTDSSGVPGWREDKDTTYSNFVGATTENGSSGLVPGPLVANKEQFLKGDATWATPPNFTGASSETAGTAGYVPAPSAGDQAKFLRADGTWAVDNNTWNANALNTAGYVAAPSGSTSYKIWATDENGNPDWRDPFLQSVSEPGGVTTNTALIVTNNTTSDLELGPTFSLEESDGALTKFLRKDGTFAVPNYVTYSEATDTTAGLVKIGYTETDQNYPVELSEGKMFVNVPWLNTTYLVATDSVAGLVKIGYSENNQNYPVELSEEKMFVNVPWINTWQQNTASQDGYVTTGAGQVSKVWKTDANGVPGWRDDADNNTWKANTSSQEGYVASGSGQANKVWKTDGSGNPAWRDDANTTYSVFTGTNGSQPGSAGLVPAPFATTAPLFLKNDGTWATVPTFTGGTVTGNITIENATPNLFLTDTNNNSDYAISNNNGVLTFEDRTNLVDRFKIYSNGNIEVTGSSIDIDGVTLNNVSGTLTWDGDPIYHEGNIASIALTGIPTAPTASAGTNTTQIATTAFVTDATTTLNTNLRNDMEWEYVTQSTDLVYASSITVDTTDGVLYDWVNYDYKFLYQGSTTAEDNDAPYIYFNGNTNSDKYSSQYHVITQTAEATETETMVGDANTTFINTGCNISTFSSGGFGTDVEIEFVVRRSRTTGSGLFGWLVKGEGHAHYWPTTQTLGTAYDGMAQSRFIGSFRQEGNITSVTVVHSLAGGGTSGSQNRVKVYRRKR